jgi:O-antigen ligase
LAFFSDQSLKTLLILILIGSLAGRPETFRKTFGFFMLAVAALQVHSLEAILAGVEFTGGRFDSSVGQISNADNVGVFFASMVPLQLELSLNAPNRTKKLLFLGSAMASIFIMIKTQTRCAFLALVVVLSLWVITRGRPGAKLKIVASFAIIVFLFGSVMEKSGTTFLGRMGTIFAESSFEADVNVKSRLYLWGQGIRIWSQFPVWGCGLAGMDAHQTASEDGISNTRDYTRGLGLTEFSLHQSFIQVLAERGLLGLIAYLFFIRYIFFCLKRTQELEGRDLVPDGFHGIAKGLQLSMIATLTGAMFISIQESWTLIFLAAFSSALYSATCLHLASTTDEICTPSG